MHRYKTHRLFYGRFPYRICILRHSSVGDPSFHDGWNLHDCKQWMHDNSVEHKIYSKVRHSGKKNDPLVSISASIFLLKKDDFDSCLAKYQDDIESVTEPDSQDHVDLLRENQSIVIRDRLYYDRYRYVVIFRRRYGDNCTDIEDWLIGHFGTDDQDSGSPFRWNTHGWDPRLYLENEDDLVMARMVWGERIRSLVVVRTWEELGAD